MRPLRFVLVLWAGLVFADAAPSFDDEVKQKSSGQSIMDAAKKHFAELQALPDGAKRLQAISEFDIISGDDVGDITLSSLLDAAPAENGGQALVRQRRKAVRRHEQRWPNAVVPYEIHSSIDELASNARSIIKSAIEHWQSQTCVHFVQYDPAKHINWVSIRKGDWCAAKLGMQGGLQPMYLARGCLKNGTVVHELGHTLGWVHEQARPDRDDHVKIQWHLIPEGMRAQYAKQDEKTIDTHNVPYDHNSIMHYPSAGEIVSYDSTKQNVMGQRERLSFHDVKLANLMYKCAERKNCDMNAIECVNGGYIGPACKCVCPDGTESCTVRNDIGGGGAAVLPAIPGITERPCVEWSGALNGAYIAGLNDDVVSGVTADECKARCSAATRFRCASVDYWREKRQCYMSAVSRRTAGVQLARDERMTYYERDPSCVNSGVGKAGHGSQRGGAGGYLLGGKPNAGSLGSSSSSIGLTTSIGSQRLSAQPALQPQPNAGGCATGSAAIGGSCVLPVTSPHRPSHLAAIECAAKGDGASLWNFRQSLIDDKRLFAVVDEAVSEGYWVLIPGYQSNDPLASFFDFCPYIVLEAGRIVIRDSYCHLKKGFICAI